MHTDVGRAGSTYLVESKAVNLKEKQLLSIKLLACDGVTVLISPPLPYGHRVLELILNRRC
jgi:hypothetical protein